MVKKMYKFIFCLLFPFIFVFFCFACAEPIAEIENKTQLLNPTVAGWYKNNEEIKIDTYIKIDFDQIKISQIQSIKFFLYKGTKLLGTATSQKDNLNTLLTNQQVYWLNTGNYEDTVGIQTLSCGFYASKKKSDDGEWQRTACYVNYPETPNYLKAYIIVREYGKLVRYTVSNNKYKER